MVALGLTSLAWSNPAEARADALERWRSGDALRLGYRTDARPFSFTKQGQPVGFTVGLCRLISDHVAASIGPDDGGFDWVEVGAADRFAALERGEIDILCGATSVTDERRLRMAFTITTYLTDSAILVDAAAFAKDAWGNRIGVLGETTSQATIDRLLSEAGGEFAELLVFGTRPEGVAALKKGEIDSLFGDRALLAALRDAAPEKFVFADNSFGEERYAIALRRGETRLKKLANQTLIDAFRSGEIDQLHTRWFGGRPMGAELRRVLSQEAARESRR